MVLSSQEKQLLDRSKAFDTAVQNRDQAAVEALLAPDVTVHKGTLSPPQACLQALGGTGCNV